MRSDGHYLPGCSDDDRISPSAFGDSMVHRELIRRRIEEDLAEAMRLVADAEDRGDIEEADRLLTAAVEATVRRLHESGLTREGLTSQQNLEELPDYTQRKRCYS